MRLEDIGKVQRDRERHAKDYRVVVTGQSYLDPSLKYYFSSEAEAVAFAQKAVEKFPVGGPNSGFPGERLVKANIWKFDRWELKDGKSVRIYTWLTKAK